MAGHPLLGWQLPPMALGWRGHPQYPQGFFKLERKLKKKKKKTFFFGKLCLFPRE
jgi:hypothetical protein